MQHIQIKDETRRLLQAHADGPFKDTSFRYDNAWWIEVDDEVHAHLEALRTPGESFDEIIRQLLTRGHA